ncbi:hypothetical protein BV22DRAFT_1073397 [Leucogyrophana mollusca]|uniref:Uncharacterized protein n=1 Tax=Leucogyrophana mollusca TaxID=85980 RepID=A0ACB8B557_9AGAM|nr:hypothetical protein BV22DRAFT_1073397 [Leucogyrophana mollusca]
MNFLDTYGITGTGTSTPPTTDQPETSLNEEVSQVIGQLGRFWGGFRKQSETAIANARKDLTEVVSQAQRELGKLTAETPRTSLADPSASTEEHEEGEADPSVESSATESPSEVASDTEPTPSSSQTFFARLQSSLPPNIVSTVQNNLPESLRNAQNIDLNQLRTTLTSEFQRVQGVTRAQAEEYVHKSESLLREAMKEAGEVLRDAVKVIPPEEAGPSASAVVWDGSDLWVLPTPAGESEGSNSFSSKGKGRDADSGSSSRRQSEDARRAVATRAESLLKQLKSNPEVIKLNPEDDTTAKESYLSWLRDVERREEGPGSKAWSDLADDALSEPLDGPALQDTMKTLVPAQMSNEVFWSRYFFRVHQIEEQEVKRKALLQGAAETEEDFSWEDDDDDATSASAAKGVQRSSTVTSAVRSSTSSQRTLGVPKAADDDSGAQSLPSSLAPTPVTMSPRESSEDSYDVVSGNVSNAGEVSSEAHKSQDDDDDADSDWE